MTEPTAEHIDGILLIPLTPHPDDRGSFTEGYRREWLRGGDEMVQSNLSISHANVLRGMHFHKEQADYWIVLRGRAFVALHDLREGSPTQGRKQEIVIDADEQRFGLYIPKGIAHGFYAQTDVWLQYLVDRYFTGADEFGIAWDDPDLGIAWPGVDPVLSERDRSNPSLAEVKASAPPYRA
jgi:dTDP-4-dehydrorhamnose 3,5-epimerase